MKQVLITGAAGGLGRVTSEYLAARGWHVFAADVIRKKEAYPLHPQINPISVDLTSETSITNAFNYVSEQIEGLDAIVNLAGTLILGSVVEIPSQDIEQIMNINLMGIYRINKAFLPLLLKRKGRIINVSSETGWQSAAPFNGPYSMTKHALEAYSDALRRELNLLDIKVIKIQPGAFKAGMTRDINNLFSNALKSTQLFRENLSSAIDLVEGVYDKANDPDFFARVVYKSLKAKKPKTRYSVKPDRARMFLEWLPAKWADRIFQWKLGKGNPRI